MFDQSLFLGERQTNGYSDATLPTMIECFFDRYYDAHRMTKMKSEFLADIKLLKQFSSRKENRLGCKFVRPNKWKTEKQRRPPGAEPKISCESHTPAQRNTGR